MPLRIAICFAVVMLGASWIGAVPQEVSAPTIVLPAREAVSVGGYVYVSTIKSKVADDDIAAQTASVLSQLKSILEANGSSLEQVCNVQVVLKRTADIAAMNAAFGKVFADAPPERTLFTSWMRGTALIEINAVAVPNGAKREVLKPEGWGKNPRPYSYIVKTDDLVFFSGLVARRGTDDAVVKGGVKTQVQTILDNAGTLLETVDLDYDNIVSARVFLSSPYDFQDMNDIYGDYFEKNPPARATAVVELMDNDTNVEIGFVASQRSKTTIGGQAANGLPVSLAVQAGPRVWLSAVIGDTEKHAGNVLEQTRDAIEHLRATLTAANLTFTDVVDTTVYMRDTFEAPQVDKVFTEIFPKNPPARSLTNARLVVEPGLVEILATAIRK